MAYRRSIPVAARFATGPRRVAILRGRAVRRWFARLPALVAAAVALPIAIACFVATIAWPGRTFPGFFLLDNGVVPTAGLYSWTGPRAGIPFLSRITAADGMAVDGSEAVYALVERVPVGTPVRYTLDKDGRSLALAVPTMRFGWIDWALTVGLMASFGIVSVCAGILVAMLQPRTAGARAFLLFGVVTGLFGLTGSALYLPSAWPVLDLHFLTQALFPATFVHLGLVFPVVRRTVQRRPGLLALPYVVAIPLVVWLVRDFARDPPGLFAVHVAYLYGAASIVGLLALFAYAYRENRTPEVRPQLRSVLPGFAIGTAVGLYAFVDNALGGDHVPLNLVALTPLVTFLSVAYAIVRHDLFDIDGLLKRAFVYVLLTLGITATYAGAVALATSVRSTLQPAESPIFVIAFVVFAAVVFQPARDLVQDAVDRLFSRGRLDYRRTVSQLSAALASLLDLDEILDRVGRTMIDGLQLRSTSVLLWIDGQARQRQFLAGHMRETPAPSCEALRRHLARMPERPWVPPQAPDVRHAAGCEAAALDAALVIPLALGGELLGAFALGRPRSGRSFSRDDVELLHTLAAQTAIAVANARSYRALKRANAELEQKVDTRTAALAESNAELAQAYQALKETQTQLVHREKMASLGVLVAGVAHEINNPVSFIVGGLEPLREAVAELRHFAVEHPDSALTPTVERAGRAVEAVARGAARTAEVVKDLRTFSRLGDSRPRPIDLHESIEVTLRLLEPRLGDGIVVVREYRDLPPVEAAPGELNQVWMNLLANACDAIGAVGGRGTIRLRTALVGDDVHVSVRDDGAGIPSHVVSRVFDPFFTTKDQHEGMGLGLSIAHGIVGRHGGRIEVESTLGQGSELTVVLPVRQPPGGGASGPL